MSRGRARRNRVRAWALIVPQPRPLVLARTTPDLQHLSVKRSQRGPRVVVGDGRCASGFQSAHALKSAAAATSAALRQRGRLQIIFSSAVCLLVIDGLIFLSSSERLQCTLFNGGSLQFYSANNSLPATRRGSKAWQHCR